MIWRKKSFADNSCISSWQLEASEQPQISHQCPLHSKIGTSDAPSPRAGFEREESPWGIHVRKSTCEKTTSNKTAVSWKLRQSNEWIADYSSLMILVTHVLLSRKYVPIFVTTHTYDTVVPSRGKSRDNSASCSSSLPWCKSVVEVSRWQRSLTFRNTFISRVDLRYCEATNCQRTSTSSRPSLLLEL